VAHPAAAGRRGDGAAARARGRPGLSLPAVFTPTARSKAPRWVRGRVEGDYVGLVVSGGLAEDRPATGLWSRLAGQSGLEDARLVDPGGGGGAGFVRAHRVRGGRWQRALPDRGVPRRHARARGDPRRQVRRAGAPRRAQRRRAADPAPLGGDAAQPRHRLRRGS
jgi:hypothetical protein